MANKHILRIHETESDLLSELKDKQIAWATDINEAIWRNGNNFYYIEASKYWNGSEFIEINSDQIYNVYNWDDYLTALSDVGNIKYIYMRENIQAPSVLTQNIDVYGQCEIIVYTGSQIFSFDPSGASNCELRYRGASGSPNFTSLNFLGNSMAYVGFETLFIEDVYCRNEDIVSSLPIDVQITNGAELGTPKFQYESQDGNFTCSVGTSDFIRELWTVPIFEIQTIGSAEGYKPKGTDFLNNGSSVYSNMSQADISENFVGDVYTDAFLGLTFTTSQLSGLLRKRFIGGSVLWSFNNSDVWNPSTFSDNPISFIGRGIDFTGGVSIDEDKLCSLTLAPSISNATLKIGDITDTQNDIYVEVLNIDGDVTLDPTSTHNIYYEKMNLNGFTLTDSGNVAVQQFWNNTNDSSGGLQNAYNNSIDPEIITDATRLALTLRQGSGADTDNVIEVQNGAGTTNFSVDGNGDTTVGGDINASQAIKLSSYNNASPSIGDVWLDQSTDTLKANDADGVFNLRGRVQSAGSPTILQPNVDIYGQSNVTALANSLTIQTTFGTPYNSQKLIYRIKDNGTAQSLSWNAIYREVGFTLPTTTTPNKTIYVECIYNSNDSKWDVITVAEDGVNIPTTPGGSNTQVQFNDGGSFGGDAGLTYDKANGTLNVGGTVTVGSTVTVAGAGTFGGNLNVNGTGSFGGTVSFGGNVTVSGIGTFNGGATFGGDIINNDSSNPTIRIGKVDNTNNAGWKLLAFDSNGSVYQDHKTKSGGSLFYRVGQGTETGSARTFMEVDASNADVTFGGDVIDGSEGSNTNGVLGNKSDNQTMPFTNRTAQGTGAEIGNAPRCI